MLEVHNGQYSYIADKVIYHGREFKIPVSLAEIQYTDLMFEALREWIQERKRKGER
jgi:hypothetical protein